TGPEAGREAAGAGSGRPSRGASPFGAPQSELPPSELDAAGPEARTLVALTDILVGLLEYRDPFFRGSSSLTRLLATHVAEEMGLGASAQVDLALAAVLRDLGRLALGGRLVESPKSAEAPEGRRKIERHVDLALQLMEGVRLPEPVMLAVRHHHERWDGRGYPDGLKGEEIPLLARVLAVVDSFAAMVSPRPYRVPRKVRDAAREMKEAAGSRYDPAAVDALLRIVARRDQPQLGFVQRHHILMVSPDHPGALVAAAKLCSKGYLAEVAVDPAAARERLRRVPVSALVVSAEAGTDAAASLIHDLRLDPLFASLPVVVVDADTVEQRVRLLEAGADVCFPPGITFGELQGTLGALVRRTVRSREPKPTEKESAPWLALQGDIQDFPLAWLLQVMKYDSRTAGIGIRTATEQGAIYIEQGDAVHAQVRGGAKGEAALKEMLQWEKGRFTVQPDARPRERTIDASIMHLLLTQAVEEDHAAAGIFGAVSDHG
ncbi:MAG: HD domain-containing phosphohydrolase, partial [Gemmatimonadota bacterium]